MYRSLYGYLFLTLRARVYGNWENRRLRSAEDFGWALLRFSNTSSSSYLSAVQGVCANVHDCASGGQVTDCSNMPSYECDSTSEESITSDENGTKTLYFKGFLQDGSACGEASCEECTHYRSCAGPYLQTTTISMPAGSVVQWEWLATGKDDWYEIVVAVYSSTDQSLISVAFERGFATSWVTQQLNVDAAGSFFVRFHLGSYDETGGGVVGAEMKVRNFQFLYPVEPTPPPPTPQPPTPQPPTPQPPTPQPPTPQPPTPQPPTPQPPTPQPPTPQPPTPQPPTPQPPIVAVAPPVAAQAPCEESFPWGWVFLAFLFGVCLGACLAWLFFQQRGTNKVEPVAAEEPKPEPPVLNVEPVVEVVEEAKSEEEEPLPEVTKEVREEPPPAPVEVTVELVPGGLPEEPPDLDAELDLEKVLISLYPTLKQIFQFYSSAGTVGDADLFRMNLKQFQLLLNDCKLDVTKARAEIIFKQCIRDGRAAAKPGGEVNFFHISRSQKAELDGMAVQSKRPADRTHRAEEEKDLGYAEFVNALVFLGWDKLSQDMRSKARDGGPREVRVVLGTALWTLVEEKVRPRAGRFDACISLRRVLDEQPVKGFLARAQGDAGAFGKSFKTFVDNRTGKMPLDSFDKWARFQGLLSNKQLSMPILRECFVWAGDKDRGLAPEGWYPSESINEVSKVFMGPDYSKDETLTRHEFAMACARIAHILYSSDSEVSPETLTAAIEKLSSKLNR